MPNGNGMTNKEMIKIIMDDIKEVKAYNEKQNDKFQDFIEKHHNEHNSLWEAIRNLKGGFIISFLTVLGGLLFIGIRLFL